MRSRAGRSSRHSARRPCGNNERLARACARGRCRRNCARGHPAEGAHLEGQRVRADRIPSRAPPRPSSYLSWPGHREQGCIAAAYNKADRPAAASSATVARLPQALLRWRVRGEQASSHCCFAPLPLERRTKVSCSVTAPQGVAASYVLPVMVALGSFAAILHHSICRPIMNAEREFASPHPCRRPRRRSAPPPCPPASARRAPAPLRRAAQRRARSRDRAPRRAPPRS